MNSKLIAVIGFLVSAIFIVGFLILFVLNPKTLESINTLSLFVYNLDGMEGRLWAAMVIYLTVGMLNSLFAVGLLVTLKNESTIVIGSILLLITGLTWASFGLFPTDTQTSIGGNLFLFRIITVTLTGAIGLIVFGAEFEKVHPSKFLKWYTLSSGLLILALSFLSVFVFNDATWIRTNISITMYFVWFVVFGITCLIKMKG